MRQPKSPVLQFGKKTQNILNVPMNSPRRNYSLWTSTQPTSSSLVSGASMAAEDDVALTSGHCDSITTTHCPPRVGSRPGPRLASTLGSSLNPQTVGVLPQTLVAIGGRQESQGPVWRPVWGPVWDQDQAPQWAPHWAPTGLWWGVPQTPDAIRGRQERWGGGG